VRAKQTGANGHSRVEDGGGDLRRYLLGQMSEGEEARVERAYLASDGALEELRAREDELIEDYLAGDLEANERDRFERLFLASPARLERMLFLRALRDRAAGPPVAAPREARRAGSWTRRAAALAAVALAGFLLTHTLSPRRAVEEDPKPEPVAAGPAAPGPELPPSPALRPAPVSLRLRAPAVRGGREVPVLDPGPSAVVALEAPLDPRDGFLSHRGRVLAPDGGRVFVSPWQPHRGETTLRVLLPAPSLRDGPHVLVVEGSTGTSEEPVESYAFRVRRR
jgi:hypothetical protein